MCSDNYIDLFFSKLNDKNKVFCYVEQDAAGLPRYQDRTHRFCKYAEVPADYVLKHICRFSKKIVQDSLDPIPALYVLSDVHTYNETAATGRLR